MYSTDFVFTCYMFSFYIFRTWVMHGEDDINGYNMVSYKKRDSDDENDIQLHKIKPQEHFIEAQVQEGDTLQAIALRFYCSVIILLIFLKIICY